MGTENNINKINEEKVANNKVSTPVTSTAVVCSKCGSPMKDDQAFCSKCGTPKVQKPTETFCSKCGTKLQDGQGFCPKCGQKVGLNVEQNVMSYINQFNNQIDNKKKFPKKPIIIVASVVVVIAIVVGIILSMPNVEDKLTEGNYKDAYKIADTTKEKNDVKFENIAAYCSNICVGKLKDETSFHLVTAWKDNKNIVLKVKANNSYGNSIINYWLFSYSSTSKDWSYWESYTSDLEEKDYSDGDTSEVLAYNLGLGYAEDAMNDGEELSTESVTRINNLFKENKLGSVSLI